MAKTLNYKNSRQINIKNFEEIKKILSPLELRSDLLIEHLHLIQDSFGHISEDSIISLSTLLKLSMVEVYEVATFYAHFDVIKKGERISQYNQIIHGTTLKLVVKGQSYLEPGDMIEFRIRPIDADNTDTEEDQRYGGQYIITKIRHKVTIDDYVMALECVKDSVMSPYGNAETTYSGIANAEGPTILDLNEEDIADGGARRNGQK